MQAIGNANALPALIGDVIYEPSDYLFQMPVEPEAFPRAGGLGCLRRTRTARVAESADGRGLLSQAIYVRKAEHVLSISC